MLNNFPAKCRTVHSPFDLRVEAHNMKETTVKMIDSLIMEFDHETSEVRI